MYKINHLKEQNILEIKNATKTVAGKIYLNNGASLQELTLNGHAIIQDLYPLQYNSTYASSILFPFANRIKDGKYSYNKVDFQLETNQKEEKNALHGLVYNKTFSILNLEESENSAKITLEYIEKNKTVGFPFTFAIQLAYTFKNDALSLQVVIKNIGDIPFPYTLGWHPYFISKNLSESSLTFDSTKKLVIGNRNITLGIENVDAIKKFDIKDKQLDDCWILNSGNIYFKTPKYQLHFKSSAKENFLQVYTPPKKNTIAIEPTTGVSDSFNNKIGLQTLDANNEYAITWKIKILNN